jgi:pimeloyl-ACP methyl ester carboxylesterase
VPSADALLTSLGLAAQSVNISGPNGKTLFAWFLPVPGTTPTPAILVMHGWGAQVDASRLAVIGHSVGAGATLLRATRRNDIRAVVSISVFDHPYEVMRRLLAAGQPGRAHLLAVSGRHDTSEALQTEQSQLLAFLKDQLDPCPRA